MTRKARVLVAFICPDCQTAFEIIEKLPVRDNGQPFYNYEFVCGECEVEKHSRYEDAKILLEVDVS